MKKLMRKAVRFKGLTLGLDVHKKFIEYCVLDRQGDEVDAGRIGSSPEDLKRLLSELKKRGSLQACLSGVRVFHLDLRSAGRRIVARGRPCGAAQSHQGRCQQHGKE